MPTQKNILFVTSEIYPLIKTGGLADISGSLPLALRTIGLDVRVLVPGYPAILEQLPGAKVLADVSSIAGDAGTARLLGANMPDSDLPLLLLDCPALYARPGGPYLSPEGMDWPDNVKRFGLLCQVGALLSASNTPLKWQPDVVHCNDWQGGLIPALLHYSKIPHAKSIISIHNLAFQGNFDPRWIPRLGLPAASFAMNGVEFYGRFSFLKAGIYYSDKITTVSKSYAAEIQTPEFGCGLQGLLQERHADLYGIVNGIADDWNPALDKHLHQAYDSATLHKKTTNKLQLQHELGLQTASAIPLLCVVSRLTVQKGIDLILACAPELLHSGVQLAVLGSGEAQYEQRLHKLARSHPGLVSVTLGYNEELAHRLIAGSDIFLMPSRFEPCGLSQMYSMAYGTPPVVRRTGGLADTVTDSNETTLRDGTATGFVFERETVAQFMQAVRRALACYLAENV
ncbi:MAG TPA: glycogen synthase GlgA, partial [Gallionellaceae bacterium]|nr:glycogen synthase GlgA [Gallionellaceae bacterium]